MIGELSHIHGRNLIALLGVVPAFGTSELEQKNLKCKGSVMEDIFVCVCISN